MSFYYPPSDAEVATLFNIDGMGDLHRKAHASVQEEMKKRFGKDCFKRKKSKPNKKPGKWSCAKL